MRGVTASCPTTREIRDAYHVDIYDGNVHCAMRFMVVPRYLSTYNNWRMKAMIQPCLHDDSYYIL